MRQKLVAAIAVLGMALIQQLAAGATAQAYGDPDGKVATQWAKDQG